MTRNGRMGFTGFRKMRIFLPLHDLYTDTTPYIYAAVGVGMTRKLEKPQGDGSLTASRSMQWYLHRITPDCQAAGHPKVCSTMTKVNDRTSGSHS